jgi:Uma2 family endonuclease
MSASTAVANEIRTLADLLDRLGGVPPERILMHPAPGTATVADLIELEERENRLCELVDGVLVEKTYGFLESRLAVVIATSLMKFTEPNDLGAVTVAGGPFQLRIGLVRIPDVAFASWDRFPGGEIPTDPVPDIAPDLAVEVLSPGNTPGEMSRKLREYLAAGVRLVWFIDPQARTVTVYTSPTRSRVIPSTGTLDGGKVLPGFEVPVASLFAKLKRSPKKGKRNGR